jgi:membrane protein DedA with SNARE-associated domain
MLTNIIGAFLWATLYGLVVYSLGREVERLSGWMALLFAIALLLLIVGAAAFVRRHEEQLISEAEKALPGPLRCLG